VCDCPLSYIFNGDSVFYNSGCGCCSADDHQSRSWKDVADHYNMQTHPDVIKKYDEFWRFN